MNKQIMFIKSSIPLILYLHGSARALIKKEDDGSFDPWHITSSDISENSFPKPRSVIERGYEYNVAFHGFGGNEKSIRIGGLSEDKNLKQEIKNKIEDVTSSFQIEVYLDNVCPREIDGRSEDNIVNRLSKMVCKLDNLKRYEQLFMRLTTRYDLKLPL